VVNHVEHMINQNTQLNKTNRTYLSKTVYQYIELLSIIVSPGMIYDINSNSYYDLIDGQLLAKMEQSESAFEDLYVIELEKEKTLVIKKITNSSWSDETTKKGVFYIEERNRDKKGISLTKSDCGKLATFLKEISEK
jgi:hypothetical protein